MNIARLHRYVRLRLGLLAKLDPYIYVLWAAITTLASARMFYGYMLKQTGGEWSAPLDDVFIHFDYARATALGHPFEWTVGNGYSSGNTSLTYPFVLAMGWWLGFQGRSLMVWAAVVAATSVFGVLLAARQFFLRNSHEHERDAWGHVSSYLLPPIFLGVGALDWSLWSGMEVAFFLATWAVALVAWRTLEQSARLPTAQSQVNAHAMWLGLAGALLVTTRPEASATIAIFGLAAAHAHRRAGRRCVARLLVAAALPAVLALIAQSLANRALTGEWSANGAIVKLALNNPYMTGASKVEDYVGNLQYAALRNLDYHFAHIEGETLSELVPATWSTHNPIAYLARTAWWAGVVPLVLAMLPLAFARTRRTALILWAQIIAWFLIVALNGQVRWQNERYVMPAVAWLMILAALGVSEAARSGAELRRFRLPARPNPLVLIVLGALVVQIIGVLTRPAGSLPAFRLPWSLALGGGALAALIFQAWRARVFVVGLALLFAWDHQIPKMRDQKWFFGRASRNIRDQHIALGRYLGELKPHRVLVGDAGAILYESNLPGLDVIGLGGYHKLPFARAGVHGLAATLELLERVPEGDRPDILAVFPTWFGTLPLWFSSGVLRRFPVEGNVICGGYEQNAYRADWHLLGTGERARSAPKGDTVLTAELDVSDLVGEKEHGYVFAQPSNGWTDMRILPDPLDPRLDMFDGGRRIAVGRWERWVARGASVNREAHLVVRSAPESPARVRVRVNGEDIGQLEFVRTGGWVEELVSIPAQSVTSPMTIELVNEGPGDFVDFHEWLSQ